MSETKRILVTGAMREAIAAAIRKEDREFAETNWYDAFSSGGEGCNWAGVRFGNRFINSRTREVHVGPAQAFAPIRRIGGKTGWYACNSSWRLRGFLDLLVGGVGLRRGRPLPEELRVEAYEPNRIYHITKGGKQAMDGLMMNFPLTLTHFLAYYNAPEIADRFHDGWLRTGDVVTIDPDGYIQIVDRTKDVIKSGGEWISSVELENALMAHPKVLEAAVIAVPHPRWTERPLACIVPRPDYIGQIMKEEILEFLRPHFPSWWLPDDVVFLDQIPKTSVGKFDKKVLRQQFQKRSVTSSTD